MIVYHGTNSVLKKKNILQEGFELCKDGNYGAGIYFTLHFDLARDYTYMDGKCNDDLVIPVQIYNRNIKCLQYKTIAKRLGNECFKNPSFETAIEIPEVEVYCKKHGIPALLIQYDYYDEVVVYEKDVIRKVG